MYIYELPDWPNFIWDEEPINNLIKEIRYKQGMLTGRMSAIGFAMREESLIETFTMDVIKSSEIEGERFDKAAVRSSVARRMGIDIAGLAPPNQKIDSMVKMMLDATYAFDEELTKERLFEWHRLLFAGNKSLSITVGAFRDDKHGAMQVVSGVIGKEKVHFEAPHASLLDAEIEKFLFWFNNSMQDNILKAAIAHLWFVTLHPFDDGNGRITRAISDMCLARVENSTSRLYSMSSQIMLERKDYYKKLEAAGKGSMDITEWIEWFLGCLMRAIDSSSLMLSSIINKADFWHEHSGKAFNERQIKILNFMQEASGKKITSSFYANLCKTSQDTAGRDIAALTAMGVLEAMGEGRGRCYALKAAIPGNSLPSSHSRKAPPPVEI